jgi:hypothetical protein
MLPKHREWMQARYPMTLSTKPSSGDWDIPREEFPVFFLLLPFWYSSYGFISNRVENIAAVN